MVFNDDIIIVGEKKRENWNTFNFKTNDDWTIDNIANEFLTIYCFSQENHVLIYHNKIIILLISKF